VWLFAGWRNSANFQFSGPTGNCRGVAENAQFRLEPPVFSDTLCCGPGWLTANLAFTFDELKCTSCEFPWITKIPGPKALGMFACGDAPDCQQTSLRVSRQDSLNGVSRPLGLLARNVGP